MNIVLYTTKDGKAKFNLQAFDEQLWLTQADMAELDKFAGLYGKDVLADSGKISRQQADAKAEREYRVYEARTLSAVEAAYWDSIKVVQRTAEKQLKKARTGGRKP